MTQKKPVDVGSLYDDVTADNPNYRTSPLFQFVYDRFNEDRIREHLTTGTEPRHHFLLCKIVSWYGDDVNFLHNVNLAGRADDLDEHTAQQLREATGLFRAAAHIWRMHPEHMDWWPE